MEHTLGLWETLREDQEAPDTLRRLTDQFPVGGFGILWEPDSRWKPHETILTCRGAPPPRIAGGHAPRCGERAVPERPSPLRWDTKDHPRAFTHSTPWTVRGVPAPLSAACR